MCPKASARVPALVLAPALLLAALAGCNNLSKSDLRQKAERATAAVFNPGSGADRRGQLIQPNFCKLDTAIIARPAGDPLVESAPWHAADEQVLPADLRQALDANGLRFGVITGDLPSEILEAFNAKPPQVETRWVHVAMPEGQNSPMVLNEKVDAVTLLLNHGGRVDGRDYHDALAKLLLTPAHSGTRDVSVRVVPQINHGETQRTIAPLDNAAPFATQEFAIKDGQKEDILRDLSSTLVLKPDQTLVIGCRSDQARSLGTFLFLQPEPKSDRILQSVLLIQASRNNEGDSPLKPLDFTTAPDISALRTNPPASNLAPPAPFGAGNGSK